MKFITVYLGYSRFVVNKSEKKDKVALNKYWYFSYFFKKTNVVGTNLKSLTEALLMSTHNKHFYEEEKYLVTPLIDPERWLNTWKGAKLEVTIFSAVDY